MKPEAIRKFKRTIAAHHRLHRRDMPWRAEPTLYYVVVSEIMLQQTQVARIMDRFPSFIQKFPDWETLAHASTTDVLREWSGLGYNRRGLYLKRIAEKAVNDPDYVFLKAKEGKRACPRHASNPAGFALCSSRRTAQSLLQSVSPLLPDSECTNTLPSLYDSLLKLPGIGPNTAGSILAFAFNAPTVFIETNIRSVFIHFFFAGSKRKVRDDKLIPLIERTLDKKHPREWYYALMDYGSDLKRTVANPSRKSAHHTKQTAFKGSNRELRSMIIKALLGEELSLADLRNKLPDDTSVVSIEKNLHDLEAEGFIRAKDRLYSIL